MSQKPKSAQLPTCPSCEEPLESGDLFCGACGYDLSVVPPRPDDRPTLVMNGLAPTVPDTRAPEAPAAGAPATGTPAAGAPVAGVEWPTVSGTGSSGTSAPPPQLPEELPGLESSGSRLPAHPGDFELPAPGALIHDSSARDYATPENTSQENTGPKSADPESTGTENAGAEGPKSTGPESTGTENAGAEGPNRAATDPRTADPGAALPAGGKLCVACRAGRVDTDGYCENCGHAQPRERDHVEQELGAVAAVSDRGLRHHRNEDAFAVSSAALPDGSPAVVAVVCDGVSSATRPDEASAAAAGAANESLLAALERGTHPQQSMHDAIVVAAEAVNALATAPGGGMEHDPHRHQNAPACTIVGAVVASGLLVVGWVGDSRVYWIPDDRGGPPARLTEDDSWAAQMVAAGLMNETEAYADARAHAITGWLGADAYELEPHTASFKPDRPGVVVVCTDGLWNYAEGADEMARALPADAARRPLHAAQVLVGHALDGGGHDNVTVAVLPFALPSQGAGSAYSSA
ncbi:PP2C family serine/threonine-protein phosphatase [Streptomyces sp. NPDC051662]|uniref:PP2C family serine/threonine-protein phosphatase n=1 Tax=Streptomyces sp. NPDC051662 TaxID=3154750 RepID=UPI0034219AD9